MAVLKAIRLDIGGGGKMKRLVAIGSAVALGIYAGFLGRWRIRQLVQLP